MSVRETPLSTLNMLFICLLSVVNGNSCETIEFKGRLDRARLREALRHAFGRHPILNSTLKRRFLKYYWIHHNHSLPFDLRIQSIGSVTDAERHRHLLANIWSEPLNLFRNRPIRVCLTECDDRSVLQLITTHLWSDARAGYRLSHDIAEAYTALSEGRTPESAVIDIPDRNSAHLYTKKTFKATWWYWFKALFLMCRDAVLQDRKLYTLDSDPGRTDFEKFDFDENFLDAIRQAAKKKGVTVHSLFAAAVTRVCQNYNIKHDIDDQGTYRLLDLFSLRSFSAVDVNDLYDTMVVPYAIRCNSALGDQALVENVAKQLQQLKQGEILTELYRQRLYALTAMFLPKRFATQLVTKFIAKSNILVSNPGPVPYSLERFGSVEVSDFYSFSQLFPPAKIMFLFSTYKNCLRILIIYNRTNFSGPEIEAFASDLNSRLSRLVDAILLDAKTDFIN